MINDLLKILILEDSPEDEQLMRAILCKEGIQFAAATVYDKASFCKQLKQLKPHLILSDYSLPGFTGLEALEITKELAPETPFILLSGHMLESDAEAMIGMGVYDFILKENIARLPNVVRHAHLEVAKKSELLHVQDALHASEERYKRLVEFSPVGIFIIHDDRFLYCNQQGAEILGAKSPRELMGRPTINYIPKEQQLHVREILKDAFAGKLVKTFEQKMVRLDGRVIDAEMTGLPFELGGRTVLQAIIQDVTDRKQVETALLAEERKLRSITDAIPGVVYRYRLFRDGKERFEFVSKGTEDMFELPHQEILNDINLVWQMVKPKFVPEMEKSIAEAYNKLLPWQHEFEIVTVSGKEKWLLGSSVPEGMLPDGSVIWNGLFTDITDRKKKDEYIQISERSYRDLFDSNIDMLFILNNKGILIDVNQSVVGKYGYSKKQLLGLLPKMFDVPGKNDTSNIIVHLKMAWEGNPQRLDCYTQKKDGDVFPVELLVRRGEYFGQQMIVISARDISEREKAQQEIEQLNAELEQRVLVRTKQLQDANKELEAFNYTVSHDLRTPLRATEIYAHLLNERCKEQLNEKGIEYLNYLQLSVKQMNDLIEDLLAFAQVGRKEQLAQKVDMGEVFKEAFAFITSNGDAKTELKLGPLPTVLADGAMMKQVVVNLLSNAVKFSRKSECPTIKVSCKETDGEAWFAVEDNGVGFNMKYKDKLFRVFERLHSAEEFEGTGAGLAIVERIISRHGGTIWAESEIGKGATFNFTLPLANGRKK